MVHIGLDAPRTPDVFIVYSQTDRKYLDELLTHLTPLKAGHLLECWSDKDISPGQRWREEITHALNSAKIAVLLVSPAFLASDFIMNNEFPALLRAARDKGLRILWVPLRWSNYKHTGIVNFQPVHSPSIERPLDTLSKPERHRALVMICEEILDAEKFVNATKISVASPEDKNSAFADVPTPDSVPTRTQRHLCLSAATLTALVEQRATPEELKQAVEHLIGMDQKCEECQDRLKNIFLGVANPSDPEVAAAITLQQGSLRDSLGTLADLLGCEAAEPDTLAGWSSWKESLLASNALRYDPWTPGFLSNAELGVEMAEAAGIPWLQAISHSWLSRVRGIRGEFREAATELDAAKEAVERVQGSQYTVARAYLLHQSGDLSLRLRKFDESREYLREAISLYSTLDPDRMEKNAKLTLAISYIEAAEYEEARGLIRVLLSSRDRLLINSALLALTGEILPNLAREGRSGLAELALCLKAVAGHLVRPELGIRARAFWRDGHLAWALGARDTALALLVEARSLFFPLAPAVAGTFEAASVSLDMCEILLESDSLSAMQNLALETEKIFAALGAETYHLLALGFVRRFQGFEAATYLAQARVALKIAQKRRLLRMTGEDYPIDTTATGLGKGGKNMLRKVFSVAALVFFVNIFTADPMKGKFLRHSLDHATTIDPDGGLL